MASIPGECELVHTHLRCSVAIPFAEEPSHDQTTCEANTLVGRDRHDGDPRIDGDHRGRGLDCSLACYSPRRMPPADSGESAHAFNRAGGTSVHHQAEIMRATAAAPYRLPSVV